jgi:hypothetical protein
VNHDDREVDSEPGLCIRGFQAVRAIGGHAWTDFEAIMASLDSHHRPGWLFATISAIDSSMR